MTLLRIIVPPQGVFDLLDVLSFLVAFPTWKICETFGWQLWLRTDIGGRLVWFCLMIVVNSLLFFLAGSAIGWLRSKKETRM